MNVKDVYFAGRELTLNKGDLVRLWLDPWLNCIPLQVQFPQFFDICQKQSCTIVEFVNNNYHLPFRHRLSGEMLEQWNNISQAIHEIELNSLPDKVLWSLTKNKQFTTKSTYMWLECALCGANNKWLWKAKTPLKIKIFMGQLFRNAILTRDNMRKRQWLGNPTCSFCYSIETVNHIVLAVIWQKLCGALLVTLLGLLVFQETYGRVSLGCSPFYLGEIICI